MNAAFLIMSSAALAGADPAPPPPPPAAPVVVSSGAGCDPCGAPAGCCDRKPGLFERFKSRLGGFRHRSRGCDCAPPCPAPCPPACAPAPCPPPCPPAPSCCPDPCYKPNLLDKCKDWWGGRKKRKGPCCEPACDPCANPCAVAPGAQPPPPPPPPPPKEMPKPKDVKPKDKGNTTGIPQPLPTAPALTGSGSPY